MAKAKPTTSTPSKKPVYEGVLPPNTVTREVEATVRADISGNESDYVLARSRRDLPAGFVEVVVQQEGSDDLEFIVHADALIGALVSARDRDAN